jgi:hypothetical protein
LEQSFVIGTLNTAAGLVPVISDRLTEADRVGAIKVRFKIGRNDYKVDPGLYALGNPDAKSPVLVSANYKLSFDCLRSAIAGRSAWVLVLDTDGVNVWCAAGKGTFGTSELVNRITTSGIAGIVEHKKLILPQLSAPGVAAHKVREASGFRVIYGPVDANDLPAFLDAGMKAADGMRIKRFPLWERLVLAPVELVGALALFVYIAPVVFVLSGILGPAGFLSNAWNVGLTAIGLLLISVFVGTVAAPALLPWLPGRAFSTKGLALGLITALCSVIVLKASGQSVPIIGIAAWFLIIPGIIMYLTMNFTGSSTFTSLSGVKKEMKWAVPVEIAFVALGAVLWIASVWLGI